MDDKALEELCKWHDEQAAILRSEAGNLAAAAVAADMHAKTSAALHEAAAEIKQLRLGEDAKKLIEDYDKERLNDFVRKRFVKAAITALARNGDQQDGQAMRRATLPRPTTKLLCWSLTSWENLGIAPMFPRSSLWPTDFGGERSELSAQRFDWQTTRKRSSLTTH